MKTVVAYVSAHGLGHWAQMAPVLRALHARDANLRLVLRTDLPERILKARGDFPFTLVPGPVDVGVVQRDAADEDIPATIAAVEQFHGNWDEKAGEEARFLRRTGADLVLSNIAPLAFAAAVDAGMPSIGIASIDWHAIYAPLFPANHFSLDQILAAYRDCSLLLKLPLGMPTPAFPRQRPIGLIAGRSEYPRRELRRRLGCEDADRLALIMFGGSAVPAFRIEALAGMRDWRFIMPSPPASVLPANVQEAPAGMGVLDLIRASDAIVCKPGYGIISEAWAAGKPLIYVPRPGFPEYPYLRDWLAAHAPAFALERGAFEAGDWREALRAAAGAERAYPPCEAGGEHEAAAIVHAALPGV
jgi:hypothetical protein